MFLLYYIFLSHKRLFAFSESLSFCQMMRIWNKNSSQKVLNVFFLVCPHHSHILANSWDSCCCVFVSLFCQLVMWKTFVVFFVLLFSPKMWFIFLKTTAGKSGLTRFHKLLESVNHNRNLAARVNADTDVTRLWTSSFCVESVWDFSKALLKLNQRWSCGSLLNSVASYVSHSSSSKEAGIPLRVSMPGEGRVPGDTCSGNGAQLRRNCAARLVCCASDASSGSCQSRWTVLGNTLPTPPAVTAPLP